MARQGNKKVLLYKWVCVYVGEELLREGRATAGEKVKYGSFLETRRREMGARMPWFHK